MLFENLNQFGLIQYFRKRLTNAMPDAFAGAKFRAGLRDWDVSGMLGREKQSVYRLQEVPGLPRRRRAQCCWSMVDANTF